MRDGVRNVLAHMSQAVVFWSVLAGLGLAPTGAAIVGWVLATWTGNGTAALATALGLALVVAFPAAVAFAVLWLRARAYAAALVSDMELIGRMMRERHSEPAPWLPDAHGVLPIDNGTFEDAYREVLQVAKTIVGTDAEVGIGWLSLSGALMDFHAFSPSGQKEVRIWWRPSAQPATIGARRADRSTYPVHQSDQMPWRIDPSWRDLVTLSFAAESPFHGDVTLWPIHGSAGVALGEPSWQVEYRREDGGVRAPPVFYELVKGTLSRGSHRHYSRP